MIAQERPAVWRDNEYLLACAERGTRLDQRSEVPRVFAIDIEQQDIGCCCLF
jgi:hypothetical protein